MLSTYKIPPSIHKRKQKILNTNLNDNSSGEHDLKRPEMTSNVLEEPQKIELIKTVKKGKLKGEIWRLLMNF